MLRLIKEDGKLIDTSMIDNDIDEIKNVIFQNSGGLICSRLKYEIEVCPKIKSEIADQVGISNATLSQYLSRAIFPSLPTLAKLCKVLDCSTDDILKL